MALKHEFDDFTGAKLKYLLLDSMFFPIRHTGLGRTRLGRSERWSKRDWCQQMGCQNDDKNGSSHKQMEACTYWCSKALITLLLTSTLAPLTNTQLSNLVKWGREKEKETSKHLDLANFLGRKMKQQQFQRQVCSLYLSAAGGWDFFSWVFFLVFLFLFCSDSDSLELFSEALELFPESLEDLSEPSLLSSSSSLSLLDSAHPQKTQHSHSCV